MQERLLRFMLLSILVCLPATAQVRGAHAEVRDGTSGWVNIWNDSDKRIEAVDGWAECQGPKTGSASGFGFDALGTHGMVWRPGPGGIGGEPQEPTLAPHKELPSIMNLGPKRSDCNWVANILGVIYTDGTHEGDAEVIRFMQAKRDGKVAAIQFWVDILHRHGIDRIPAEVITSDAEQLVKQDLNRLRSRWGSSPRSVGYAYWSAWYGVDQSVTSRMKAGSNRLDDPDARSARVLREFEKQMRGIESDAAMKIVETEFPLPAELVRQKIELPVTSANNESSPRN